jgi:hypothetical protein
MELQCLQYHYYLSYYLSTSYLTAVTLHAYDLLGLPRLLSRVCASVPLRGTLGRALPGRGRVGPREVAEQGVSLPSLTSLWGKHGLD